MNSSELIRAAFEDAVPPSGRVTSHDCDECDRVAAELRSRTWQDVASNFPSYCHDAFPLLTPEAQLYFLPAYMVAAIGPEANCQGISIEGALERGGLTPAMFTCAQQAAIAAWIVDYWKDVFDELPPHEILHPWASCA